MGSVTVKPLIYIDGQEGTTGLQIYDRLAGREDIELLRIDPDKRKDVQERSKLLNQADLVFLCLPDQAAREAVALVTNEKTRIIDASTAHRTNPDWDYGFAELSQEHREKIVASRRVANPGCHASGFISSVYPLVQHGVIPPQFPITCYSLTGYSGGGKKMIAEYEDENREPCHQSCRIYGLPMNHKHLPEMKAVCQLEREPVFAPVVGDYYPQTAHQALSEHYAGQKLVTVAPLGGDESVIYSDTMAGRDSLRLLVYGREGQTAVTALFDNLGKGASGAAVQNMNLMLGFDETAGLTL